MSLFSRQGWKRTLLVAAMTVAGAVCASNVAAQGKSVSGTFTDKRDGKTYKTVKIGGKVWMAENLKYNNGVTVGDGEFVGIQNYWCGGYETDADSCDKYGGIYGTGAASKACPPKWHLPTEQEWDVLFKKVGGREVAGKKLKAKNGWGESGGGTDEYGFSALASPPIPLTNVSCWWSSEFEYEGSIYFMMFKEYDSVGVGDGEGLCAVRCVQN